MASLMMVSQDVGFSVPIIPVARSWPVARIGTWLGRLARQHRSTGITERKFAEFSLCENIAREGDLKKKNIGRGFRHHEKPEHQPFP
ncbi:hypothetical protein [Pseudomonas sp. NFACC37-1]|uniref:hypothetical protein n=1 Tax=Pseudomonas sp. NFACC37-1 TaxID=1566196 RepID=UPI00147D6B0E|nr:hypothetical protein [Pseudomonas sp. NFACC37-1]